MSGSEDLALLIPGFLFRASVSQLLQTTLFVVIVMAAYKIVRYWRTWRHMEKVFGDMPGPKGKHWLRGSFKEFTKLTSEGRLMKLIDWCNEYSRDSGYYRSWGTGTRAFITTCHPSTIKRILKTSEPKVTSVPSGYRYLLPWLGEGLLISSGAKWARNRRLLTPAFHFDILKPYMNVYNKSADVLIWKLDALSRSEKFELFQAKLDALSRSGKKFEVFQGKLDALSRSGERFEVFQVICLCTLDIILKCAFSYNEDIQTSGDTHPYVKAVTELATTVSDRLRNPLLLPDLTFYLSSMGRKFKKNCDYVHSVAEEIIEKRKATLKANGENLKDSKYLDFLDILLTARDENGAGLSPLDIRNEVDTFLFEGHDTTASAISWILYSLAEHPEYQRKCQQEIDAILHGRATDDLEWSDLQRLDYLTMCVKEGMRLHCPVAIVGRMTTKDFDIGDRIIPKDTPVSISMWTLHHNKHVWGDDHMEFVPERFTKDNIAKMDPYQFVPFAGGPRNCIGQHFAMNEEKVVLSKLLRNFTFRLDPDHVVRKRLSAVMRAETGILMFAERRTPN